MSVAARLAAFGLALTLAFVVGIGLGAAFGPDPATPAPKAPPVSPTPMQH